MTHTLVHQFNISIGCYSTLSLENSSASVRGLTRFLSGNCSGNVDDTRNEVLNVGIIETTNKRTRYNNDVAFNQLKTLILHKKGV